jgi:hypothetical protein
MGANEQIQAAQLAGAEHQQRVFIVHADYDADLAQALIDLLVAWGFDAFSGRPGLRQLGGELYRTEVSQLLLRAEIVIPIVSNAFRHSLHCHAESGIAVALGKSQIPVLIPPVSYGNYAQISPMIAAQHFIDGGGRDFAGELRVVLQRRLGEGGMPKIYDVARERAFKKAADEALADLVESYTTVPPVAELTGIWPNGLTDKDAIKASRSVAAHLRRAVSEGETNLAVAGVSLKFSVNIITEAINSLSALGRGNDRLRGPLNIVLTHVDDQAHVLHSIEDRTDIRSVVHYFRVDWTRRKSEWESAGRRAGIEVNVSEPAAIDYIPQQAGIRIHSAEGGWSVLYAGQCAFEKAGFGLHTRATKLRVGEGEYAFYTDSLPSPYPSALETRGAEIIDIFNQYIRHYSESQHNDGAAVVEDAIEWVLRLQECVSTYADVTELLLFSDSCTKFMPLVEPALNRGCTVRIYVTRSDKLTEEKATHVRSLHKRLVTDWASAPEGGQRGRVELYELGQPPTFRAAIIGDALLGLEPYVPGDLADDSKGIRSLSPSGLRLIVTKYSAHFDLVRAALRDQCRKAAPV